jgi:GR25 family glycosyltransferase involved in LPS biosynthesis
MEPVEIEKCIDDKQYIYKDLALSYFQSKQFADETKYEINPVYAIIGRPILYFLRDSEKSVSKDKDLIQFHDTYLYIDSDFLNKEFLDFLKDETKQYLIGHVKLSAKDKLSSLKKSGHATSLIINKNNKEIVYFNSRGPRHSSIESVLKEFVGYLNDKFGKEMGGSYKLNETSFDFQAEIGSFKAGLGLCGIAASYYIYLYLLFHGNEKNVEEYLQRNVNVNNMDLYVNFFVATLIEYEKKNNMRSKFGKMRSIKKKAGIKSYRKVKCPRHPILFETYVINCGVHSKRMSVFKKYADKAGLEIEREECVNGKAYTNQLIVKMIKDGIVGKNAELSPIEVAICLSHYNCWVRFLQTGCSPYCLILEDDAQVKPNFVDKVTNILEGLESRDKHFGVLILHPGNWMRTKSLQKRVGTIDGMVVNQETVPHNPSGTAYILTRPFAEYLVKNMFPIRLPVDIYIGDNFVKRFPHYTLVPIRDPKADGCWKATLLDVGCGGDEGSTQDYEVDNTKTIFKKYKIREKKRSKKRFKF